LKATLIVVSGPTAVGKTALAIQLAQHFQTEIISADARQFYREISIGTAKPNADELAQAKHHFIDSHSVTEVVDAGSFEKIALAKLQEIFSEKSYAILVGGSGLYTQAVCEGLDDLTFRDDELRASLQTKTAEELQSILAKLDPDYFALVDLQNKQRMMRAIEVSTLSGKAYSSHLTGKKKQRDFGIIKIAITDERAKLYERINHRVDQMMANGLVAEVKNNIANRACYALKTVGYKEIFDMLDGRLTLEQSVEAIKQNTRRFAKRQLTWLRRDPEYQWFAYHEFEKIKDYIIAQQI
jgi:tRNA dimethylallyltransferase